MTMARTLGHVQLVEPPAMNEMNTTPLIDVMLVLLIMFIITLPPTTHAVKIDPPADCTPTRPCPLPRDARINQIDVAPGDAVFWNGTPVSMAQLAATLKASQAMDPPPELRLHPDANARHETVLRVIRETKIAKIRNMGIIGNEDYAGY